MAAKRASSAIKPSRLAAYDRVIGTLPGIVRKGASIRRLRPAGNSHLRAAAYRMAVVGVQHNPVIAALHARKRAAGKSEMNALGHCMRKALSLVWGVWRNGQDFDPSWGVEA